MITVEIIDRIIGANALDVADDRLGEVVRVEAGSSGEQPAWAAVRMGRAGADEVLVPLDDAVWDERALHVPVGRDVALDAPRVPPDAPLSRQDQERLYTHYGIPTPRHPRIESVLPDPDDCDVSYSVRDDADSMPEPNISGHLLEGAPALLSRA